MKLPRFGLVVICLLFSSSRCEADFDPIAGWQEQVFPSYLIATAAMKDRSSDDETILGDRYGSFGVSVTAPADNTNIHVTVQCDGYSETSEFVGVLPTAGITYRVYPKMRYRFDRLSRCKQATPSIAVFKVQLNDGVIEEETCTITMRSINDCPFAIVADDETTVDLSHIFAAYVNEQHPFVDKLLREALDIGMVNSFTGYQSDPDAVLAQVYSLWDLMVTRDVRYSSITATAAVSEHTHSQHVRLLEETVNNTQANCVDGSVLFASMLRKIGIDSVLVLTDDHCYLAFWTDAKHERMYGLETTMVSLETTLDETPEEFANAVDEDLRWEHSWASFISAILTGTSNLQSELEKEQLEIDLIDVNEARAAGVLPIPFASQEEFVAVQYDDYEESDESTEEEMTDDEAADDEVMMSDTAEEDQEEELASDEIEDLSWDDDESSKASKNRKPQPTADLQWD